MSYTYAERERTETSAPHKERTPQGPSLDALRAGAAAPTAEQMGRRVNLPDAMREKMEGAFGADLSAVKLYESETVADAGAKAVTQGANIAFAPGVLDFTSFGGQALLGHELSHVVSQARGEVTGSGYLNSAALEARADREGAMAAAGQQIAMPTAALSGVTAAAADGPMQAVRDKKNPSAQAQAGAPAATALPPRPTGPAPRPPQAAAAAPAQAPAQAPAAAVPPAAASTTQGALPARPVRPAPRPSTGFEFVHGSLPGQFSGAADATLDPKNAGSFRHGKQYREMMGKLSQLSSLRQGDGDMGQLAREAMIGNANQQAIDAMKSYRRKLKGEWTNKGGRKEQIAALKTMIRDAKADQEAYKAQANTTLPAREFSGTIKGGGINQVYRYARGGQGAYFKPMKVPAEIDESYDNETPVMDLVGIQPWHQDAEGKWIDPRLSEREVAFARLGSLLGTSVVGGSKLAKLDQDAPKGQTFGGKTFRPRPGRTGVLTDEAEGRMWLEYGWKFFGITPPASASPAVSGANTAEEILTAARDNYGEVTTLRDRMETHGYDLSKQDTGGANFDANRVPKDPKQPHRFRKDLPQLDMADPDYQRQMNEMFLLDTLAGHTDRHAGNYMVRQGADGKVAVTAIDNDLTFGAKGSKEKDAVDFGKNLGSSGYSGLPAQMHIDANMAERIRKIDRKQLDLAFSDLLSKEEIDALETRFEEMRRYIDAIEKEHPELIVKQWNEETAKRETELASGNRALEVEDRKKRGGFGGNSYFQRQAIELNLGADPRLKDIQLKA